jgi:glycosyltransferase involved in cell wall biosynthesis
VAKQMNVAAFIDAADQRFAKAGITLDIIGDTPESFEARWGNALHATRFRGFVADVQAELAAARIGLMIEATGGGFKLKVLDYLYNRVPVFALAGSFDGLPDAVADAFVIAPDMATLVERVIAGIDDLPRLNYSQDRAYAGAADLFSWAENGRKLEAALAALAAEAAPPTEATREALRHPGAGGG